MYNKKYFCYKRPAYEHEKCGPFSLVWHEVGGLEGHGAFDWINDYMHNALDAEVLPGE